MTAEKTNVSSTPASASGPSASTPTPPAGRPRLLLPLILIILGVAGYFVWKHFFSTPALPPSIVAVSGRIEGDDSAIAPKTAGRILEVRVREGDHVKAGDVIALLDDAQILSREEQAQAALDAAEARVKSERDQVAVYQQQIQQNNLQAEQATIDAQGRVAQAQSDVAAAESEVAQQEASLKIAQFDRDAYQKLVKTGAASERQATQAAATADQQAAAVASARRKLEAARGALTTAQANLSNPGIRQMQSATIQRQITQQQGDIDASIASAAQARAQLAEAKDNRTDLIITAPFDGTIITRAAEPGEVVQAGTAIVTLLDLSKVYLRGFVPEGEIGKVKIGQPARIFLDSDPSRPVDAEVQRIDPQATFTPENTYFRDDRVKQVVGLKLFVKGALGFAKPGMPADGQILVEGTTWPAGQFNK